MTDRIAEIEARANAATPGPWCNDSWEIYQDTEYTPGLSEWIGETARGDLSLIDEDRANAAFIAAAREDVPWLIAELRKARAERAEAEAKLAVRERQLSRLDGELVRLRDENRELTRALGLNEAEVAA